MRDILSILLCTRSTLLGAPQLPRLCSRATRARNVCACICIACFLAAGATVIGFRLLPLAAIPTLLAAALILFVLSASLASRFGRLTDAEKSLEYSNRIRQLSAINPRCADYVARVRGEARPFTRLDLDELGAIHIRSRASRR